MKYRFLLLVFTLNFQNAFAAGKCTGEKLAKVQRKLAKVLKNSAALDNPWQKMELSFEGNRECMNEFETADFGDAVRYIMIHYWQEIADIEKYKLQDRPFYNLIIDSLKAEAAPMDDIRKIHFLAATTCPAKAQTICRELETAIKIDSPQKNVKE